MIPILALNMDEAKAWIVIIAAIAAAVGSIVSTIQNARARSQAEKSEVKIDKTLKNTNGNVHKMAKKISSLEAHLKASNLQNTSLKQEAVKDKERTKRKAVTR